MMIMRYVGLLILYFVFTGNVTLRAQLPKVTLSAAFPEPSADGWDKLVLLQNRNTCYLHFERNEGIRVSLYNGLGQLTFTELITGRQWDKRNMNDTEIDGVYEMNGQVVIFLQQLIKYKPCLFRILIDGNTGRLLQEEKIGELSTVPRKDAYALNNLASHDFFVAKDPYSGCYAIAFFTGGELQRKENVNERIKVMHFAPDHQLINQAYYALPDTAYSYFSYLDMAVQGKACVYLCTAGFNTRRTAKQEQSIVLVSALKEGHTAFIHQPLDYTANFGNALATMQWASAARQLQLLLVAAPDAKARPDEHRLFMNYLDPATCSLQLQRPLNLAKAAAGSQPQLLTIQPDGSTILQLEQMQRFTQGKNVYNMQHTSLDNISICNINAAGGADSVYGISKMQIANGVFEPLYLQRKNKGTWVFRNRVPALNTTPYMSFDYVHTSHGDYTLFNDYLQHLDRGGTFEGKKPLRYLTDANTICYYYNKGQGERLFLFGTPETDKAWYCMLGASACDTGENRYATILIARNGAEKKAHIAWIRF